MTNKALIFVSSLAFLQGAVALEIRSYSASRHDRFLDFPSAPKINPDFLYASVDLTGVGWYLAPSNTAVERRRQYTLVSPKHFVGAFHFRPSTNGQLRFLARDGVVRTYEIESFQPVLNPNGDPSDLLIGTLETEVLPSDGINHQPFLSLPEASYLGQELIFTGHLRQGNPTLRAGRAVLQARTDFGRGTAVGGDSGIERTETFTWTYRQSTLLNTGNPDDSFTEPGDSGSPSLVNVNGRGALVGTHTAAGSARLLITSQNISYDTFVPFYVEGLNEVMAAEGYHMTRAVPGANQPTTTLDLDAELPETIRAGYPVSLSISLTNTGNSENANNLKLLVPLPESANFNSAGDGWISVVEAPGVRARKGGLTVGDETRFTVDFTPTLPGSFPAEIRHSADETNEMIAMLEMEIIESYRSWSAALVDSDPTADPDGDGIPNLQEYAFGGDPQVPSRNHQADGRTLVPAFERTADGNALIFLRRTDATRRALNYIIESSPDLSGDSWELVAANAGEMVDDSPASGFERVRVILEDKPEHRFFRVRVELNE